MACRRSAVRSRLAPPTFARFASDDRQAPRWLPIGENEEPPAGGFFIAPLLTARAASLHDARARSTAGETVMQGKIALEEHFAIEATLGDSQVFGAQVWDTLGPRLIDIQDLRLKEMDKHGVEMMILSLNAPAVQAIHDVKRAIAVAREANDVLAAHVRKRP